MKWLIVDTYYPAFLKKFYREDRQLASKPFLDQRQALLHRSFGTADFYSLNLKRLGHEAQEVVANCEPMQRAWARENGDPLVDFKRYLPGQRGEGWLHKVLAKQIRTLEPDILYIQDINWTHEAFLREVRPDVRFIVGQTAYSLRPGVDFSCYNLILTSFPHYVDRFRDQGVPSEYLRLGFEPEVLNRLGTVEKAYGAVFVGGFTGQHHEGTTVLETVAQKVPVDFWGYGVESLPAESPIHATFHGEAWGLDMYGVLAGARIVLNRHIDLAGVHANNMRLYEATGVGAMLLTDHKDDLGQLFQPGAEVAVYKNADQCAELIAYYLEHEEERAAIAKAGQQRTLDQHNVYHRMQDMVDIVETYLQREIQHGVPYSSSI